VPAVFWGGGVAERGGGGGGGVVQCGRTHFLMRIFEIYCVRTNIGVEQARIFFGQEKGSIFRDFVRTSFMDGPFY